LLYLTVRKVGGPYGEMFLNVACTAAFGRSPSDLLKIY
jgi:hypothetical protein